MRAFGFKVVNPSSSRRKQWTCVVLDNGNFYVNWGAGNVTGRFAKNLDGYGGEPRANFSLTNRTSAFRNEFTERTTTKGYTEVAIKPQMVELSNELRDAIPAVIVTAFVTASSNTVEGDINAQIRRFTARGSVTATNVNPAAAALAGANVPAPAPAAPVALRVSGEIRRPNGEIYLPRFVQGHHDVALLRHLTTHKMWVRLYGPPGGGKTALAEAAFPTCVSVSGHGDFTVSSFVGSLLPTAAGGWEWAHGPLTRAMVEGRVLFIDEINRIPVEVLAVLYSVLDGRGVLRLDDRPDMEPIAAREGFGVVAGYNPDTLGSRSLDEALLSRFRIGVEVKTDFDAALSLGVPEKAVAFARNLQTQDTRDRQQNGYGVWVPQMRELIAFRDLIRAGLDQEFAVSVLVGTCPVPENMDKVTAAAREVFGIRNVATLSLGRAV